MAALHAAASYMAYFPPQGQGSTSSDDPPAANPTSGFDLSDFIFFDEGSTPPTSFAQFGTGAITPQPATESAYAGQSSGSSVPASGSSTTSGIRYVKEINYQINYMHC